jgi:hypothetical protein
VRYEDVADLLPGLVDGTIDVDDATLAFVGSDLRCQAELVRYRKLLRDLATMRDRRAVPPAGSLEAALAALGGPDRSVLRRLSGHKRLAGAALGTAVVTAGAAAVILARSRRRALVAA